MRIIGFSISSLKLNIIEKRQKYFHISFEEAALKFYKAETYKTLQETENGVWAESAEIL